MATINGTSANDIIIPTVDGGTYRGGQGNDTYILTSAIPANATIVIVDTEGANKIQLVDGLTIASSIFATNSAGVHSAQLTLSNGAKIQIEGADNFTFDVGANVTAGDTAASPNATLAQFATTLGVASLPANGATANGAAYTVPTTGSTPAVPTLSIANATLAEGNSGTANMTFTVTLSAASASAVTVAYATTGGTATSAVDFTATSGTLTIPAGSTTGTITVPIVGDTVFEPNETFTVTLSSPTNATVSTTAGSATGTITNDDTNALPVITVPATSPAVFIGSSTPVTGISFTDADDNAGFTVVVQAAGSSQVSFSSLTNVSAKNAASTAILAGESSNLITLTGTKADVNAALATLKYSTNSSVPTSETLTLTVTDPNAGSATKTLTISVGQSLTLTSSSTDSLVGSAGDDLFSGTFANLHTTDTITASTGTDKLALTSVNGTVAGAISGVETLDLTLTGNSTVTVSSTNFGSALNTVNTSGAFTLGGTFNSGTTFNLDTTTNAGLTVTNLLVPSTSVASAVTTDAVTLNLNGSATAASVLTSLTDTASTIDTLNIVSTGTFSTANSITTLGTLATNATVNVSGAQAFTVTLPNLGTGKFDATNASGKITVTASNNATTIIGGSAGDSITGSSGVSDSISGLAGNDTIVGGTAADTITGGLGADSITGGATGVNTYVFAAGDSPSTGRDTLVDLREGDIIKFGTALTGLTNAAVLGTSSASPIYVDNVNNRLVVGSDQINIPSAVVNAAFTYSTGADATAGTADDTLTVGAAPLSSVNNELGKLTVSGKVIGLTNLPIDMSLTPPQVNSVAKGSNGVTTLDAANVTNAGVIVTGSAGNDTITLSSQADTFNFLASGTNGKDTITNFTTTSDKLDCNLAIAGTTGNINAITLASAAVTTTSMKDTVEVIPSCTGAAASLTTSGAATLAAADLTASTLTNVATFLAEHWTGNSSATGTDTRVFVFNSNVTGATGTAYIYQWDNDTVANVIQPGELSLIGVVTGTVVSGDIVALA